MARHHVLIIGGGSIGERHLRCFQHTGRAHVELCEIDAGLRRTLAERYSLLKVYASLDAALATPPGVAVICTPAHLHVPMATQLVEAGAHVLIEKPLSTSREGVDRLQALVQARGVVAAVAYIQRAHPALGAMREAIAGGRFGRPVQVVVTAGQHFPSHRPAYREIYYNDRATGGGAIQDALTHLVNAAEWIAGPVTRLAADADHLVLPGIEVEDSVNVIARHGGVLASYSLNQHQAPDEITITVICERGTARCELHRYRWLSAETPGQPWQVESEYHVERDETFIAQAARFLDAVEGTATVACSIDEARQTLNVNLAVLEAVRTQSWQAIQ